MSRNDLYLVFCGHLPLGSHSSSKYQAGLQASQMCAIHELRVQCTSLNSINDCPTSGLKWQSSKLSRKNCKPIIFLAFKNKLDMMSKREILTNVFGLKNELVVSLRKYHLRHFIFST